MLTIEEIARHLGNGRESKVADGWITTCPAHNDGKASLSLRNPHGKVLIKCHAGCTQEAVIEALIERDLWQKKTAHESWKPMRPVPTDVKLPSEVSHSKHGKPKRTWQYRELDGSLIGLIHRFEDGKGGKTLIPMCYCYSDKGGKMWSWKSFDKPRPLYNLPLFQKYKDLPVLILEGEKAADAAQKIFEGKYICTTWPGGSAAVKYCDVKYLKGRTVVLWPDNDEPGQKAMRLLAEIMISDLGNTPSIVDIPVGLPEGWDVADDVPDDFSLDCHVLVSRAQPYVSASDPTVSGVNKEYGFIITGGKPSILYEKKKEDGSVEVEYWSVDGFKQYFSNQTVPSGRNVVKLGDHWLTHPDRRTYRGLIFEPGLEIRDHYNLWQGYSYEPDEAGDWSMFEEHLRKNVCADDEELYMWVLGWFAHIIQFPRDKIGTSLSLRGSQGTGKTIVGKIFGSLIKRHYTLIDQERYLFGNFNSHMGSTLLLHSDEGFWGGDPRHVGKLKSLVTSDTHFIEHKGKDSLQVNNYLRLLITTNEDWVIPAAFDERRFAVLDVGNGNAQDKPYFVAMLKQMKNGGFGALLHYLINFDLTQTDVGVLPETMALSEQKESSMGPIETYWFTCLQQGNTLLMAKSGWLNNVVTSDFHDDCMTYLNKLGYRRMPHINVFFRKLRGLMPPEAMKRRLVGANRQSAVDVPSLEECRMHFDKMMRTNHDWFKADIIGGGELNLDNRIIDDEEIPF